MGSERWRLGCGALLRVKLIVALGLLRKPSLVLPALALFHLDLVPLVGHEVNLAVKVLGDG